MTQETAVEPVVTDAESAAEALMAKWDKAEEPVEEVSEEAEGDSPDPVEATDDGDEPESDDQEPDAEEPESNQYTVEDLADALEMTPEDFLAAIKVKAKVSGDVKELTLGELQKGYQREADYTRKTQELAEQRKATEAYIAQQREAFTAQQTELSSLIQATEQNLNGQYANVNWEQLRAEDPAEYAARIQDYQLRQNQLQQWKQHGTAQWNQYQQQLQAEQQQRFQQQVEQANEVLTQKMPEWADEVKRTEEQKAISEYLMTNGYRPEELSNLADHRALLLAHKAMMYDRMEAQGKVIEKKVKKLPKMLKSGVKPNSAGRKKAALKDKMARLKRSGSVDDAAALLLDRLS